MKLSDCLNKKKNKKFNIKNKKKGSGLIDYILNQLPEIHLSGRYYYWCFFFCSEKLIELFQKDILTADQTLILKRV